MVTLDSVPHCTIVHCQSVTIGRVEGSYHLFLSHVWSSGQDQMRITKQRLRELTPDVQVLHMASTLTLTLP